MTGPTAHHNPARPEPSDGLIAAVRQSCRRWWGDVEFNSYDIPHMTRTALAYLAAHPSEAPAEVAAYWRQVGAAEALNSDPCTCGYGGFHEELNPRCDRNRARAVADRTEDGAT